MGITRQYADSIVVTHDNKILLQQRPDNGGAHSGALCAFGGHVEEGENFMEALVRELREELGAIVNPDEVIFLGEFREDDGSVVHIHFWRDKNATITGCYEWEARSYDTAAEARAHPGIMKYAEWALLESQRRGLLSEL